MQNETLPKIYSKKAIMAFSVLMSTPFGGILLFINLRALGKKKEANIVLVSSVILTLISIYIVNIPAIRISSIAYLCGAVGGMVLCYFFIPRYIPTEEQYPKKKIWKPLIIAVVIVVIIVAIMISANAENI